MKDESDHRITPWLWFGLVLFILHPSSFREAPVQIDENPIILISTELSRTAHHSLRLATSGLLAELKGRLLNECIEDCDVGAALG